MAKIYLSKSNAANPNLVKNTRKVLVDLGHIVFEFTGTKYTAADNDVLLSADYLLLVPPEKQDIDEDYEVNVGRGQYEQVEKFKKQHGWKNIYTVYSVLHRDLDLKHIDDFYLDGKDYTNKWAILFAETDDYNKGHVGPVEWYDTSVLYDASDLVRKPDNKVVYEDANHWQGSKLDRGIKVPIQEVVDVPELVKGMSCDDYVRKFGTLKRLHTFTVPNWNNKPILAASLFI